MSEVSWPHPIIFALLAGSTKPSKGMNQGQASESPIAKAQDVEFGEVLELLSQVAHSDSKEGKKRQGIPSSQAQSDELEKTLLIGLIHQALVLKKNAFLTDRLSPEAKEAYIELLDFYQRLTRSFPSEKPKGLKGPAEMKDLPSQRTERQNSNFPARNPPKQESPRLASRVSFAERLPLERSLIGLASGNSSRESAPLAKRTSPIGQTERLLMLLKALGSPQDQAMALGSAPKPDTVAPKPQPSGQNPGRESAPLAKGTSPIGQTEHLLMLLKALGSPQDQAMALGSAPKPQPSGQNPGRESAPLAKGTSPIGQTERLLMLLKALGSPEEWIPSESFASDRANAPLSQNLAPRTEPSWQLPEEPHAWDERVIPILQKKNTQNQAILYNQEAGFSLQAASPTKTDAQGVLKQVQEAILTQFSPDRPLQLQKHTIEIALEPSDLGRLLLHMDLKGGDLKVSILTSSHEASQLLKQGYTNLQQSLKEHGLDLTQFSLSVGNPGSFDRDFEGFLGQGPALRRLLALNLDKALPLEASAPALPHHQGILSVHV